MASSTTSTDDAPSTKKKKKKKQIICIYFVHDKTSLVRRHFIVISKAFRTKHTATTRVSIFELCVGNIDNV